jgi:hypothetical protein
VSVSVQNPQSVRPLTKENNACVRYELGNYLGGGIAGVVYEAESVSSHQVTLLLLQSDFKFCSEAQILSQHVALKILNPVGYKLERKATLKQVLFHFFESASVETFLLLFDLIQPHEKVDLGTFVF